MVTGDLPSDQQAYLPLSNESQVYGSEDSNTCVLTQDMKYSGAIPNDKFLLPFKITGSPGDVFKLVFPAGLRVWTNSNRSGEPVGSKEILGTLDNSGVMTLYAEGIEDGQWTIALWKKASDQPPKGNHIGDMVVNVFSFTGPQNVPNYSDYNYSVQGLPTGDNGDWSVRTVGADGTVQDGQGSIAPSGNEASVFWGAGGLNGFGQISYQASDYYTWSYYVNIIGITIGTPTAGGVTAVPHPSVSAASTPGRILAT